MNDITFNFPKRHDENEAKEGVWFCAFDEYENSWGEYKVALFNQASPNYRIAAERWNRQHKRDIETKKFKGDEGIWRAFVDLCLLDWKNVPFGKGGKDLPFDKDTAFKLFINPEFKQFANDILNFAMDVRNFNGGDESQFKGDAEAEVEDNAKN
jgi:hypothetical protein